MNIEKAKKAWQESSDNDVMQAATADNNEYPIEVKSIIEEEVLRRNFVNEVAQINQKIKAEEEFIAKCDRCLREKSLVKRYKFWYGRLKSTKTNRYFGLWMTIETKNLYSIDGSKEVLICNCCMRKERLRSLRNVIISMVGFFGFYFGCRYNIVSKIPYNIGRTISSIVVVILLFIFIWLFYTEIHILFASRTKLGDHLAIEMNRKHLKKLGYHGFFVREH